jgi:hypothetical protein
MTKKELEEKIHNLKHEIVGLYNLAKELGNKNPQDNFMIKDRLELLQKFEKQLKESEK